MSEKVERLEPVEDALFALLMEDFMKKQGEELLEENEKLKREPEDPALTASKERFQKVIYRYFKQQAAPRRRKRLKTIGRVLAAAILAMVLLSVTAFAVSEPFRDTILNMIIQVTDSGLMASSTEYSSQAQRKPLSEEDFVLGWMPEGFEETIYMGDESEILCEYTNEDGAHIYVNIMDGNSSSISLLHYDDVQNIEIGDHSAYLAEYTDSCEIIWVDNERVLIVNVYSDGGVDTETTLKVAENLSY
jgi:hypothetical protein